MQIITEAEFSQRIRERLTEYETLGGCAGWVTGPGRSGAVAAVYASHILRIPFVPYGSFAPAKLGRVLLIDTARESGRTLRKAERRYERADPFTVVCYEEPPRVTFWYEGPKPQHYRHEKLSLERENLDDGSGGRRWFMHSQSVVNLVLASAGEKLQPGDKVYVDPGDGKARKWFQGETGVATYNLPADFTISDDGVLTIPISPSGLRMHAPNPVHFSGGETCVEDNR